MPRNATIILTFSMEMFILKVHYGSLLILPFVPIRTPSSRRNSRCGAGIFAGNLSEFPALRSADAAAHPAEKAEIFCICWKILRFSILTQRKMLSFDGNAQCVALRCPYPPYRQNMQRKNGETE